MNNEELKNIQDEVIALISQIGVDAGVVISVSKQDEEEIINIQLETASDQVSLIGFHGENLQALQLIISFLCHKKLGNWAKVLVNVGDYRQKREEQLKNLALSLAMKAKFSGEIQTLPNLSASERRFIHILLVDNPDVSTESEGIGHQRMLTIRPKK